MSEKKYPKAEGVLEGGLKNDQKGENVVKRENESFEDLFLNKIMVDVGKIGRKYGNCECCFKMGHLMDVCSDHGASKIFFVDVLTQEKNKIDARVLGYIFGKEEVEKKQEGSNRKTMWTHLVLKEDLIAFKVANNRKRLLLQAITREDWEELEVLKKMSEEQCNEKSRSRKRKGRSVLQAERKKC